MFRSIKKNESNISVELEELLTGEACTEVIIEIMKYIMYQKQQIPLACDSLIKLYSNSKPTDKNFSTMQSLVKSLYDVSYNLTSQFSLDGCDIKEFVIVIGATIFSPKLCIRIELPPKILNSDEHLYCQHSARKSLLNVMRAIFECTEFQNEMAVPLGPTNTFLLVQKKDPRNISKFFVPKPQFNLSSQNTTCFNIKLNYSENSLSACNCGNLVKVYCDSVTRQLSDENCSTEESNCESEVSYEWYQSKEIFKGFKFLR